jgi:hypothetical protein
MQIVEEHLSIVFHREGILDTHFPVAEGFDLGSAQRDPGLEGFEDLVIMSGLAVFGKDGAGIRRGHQRKHREKIPPV